MNQKALRITFIRNTDPGSQIQTILYVNEIEKIHEPEIIAKFYQHFTRKRFTYKKYSEIKKPFNYEAGSDLGTDGDTGSGADRLL